MNKEKALKLAVLFDRLGKVVDTVGFFLVGFVMLAGIPILLYFRSSAYEKRQERICVASCQPQKVVGVQAVGVLGGIIYYYELEDGGLLPSNDKSIRIGDEVCECSGKVVKFK